MKRQGKERDWGVTLAVTPVAEGDTACKQRISAENVLIWAYRDQRVLEAMRAGASPGWPGLSMTAIVQEVGMLGAIIRGTAGVGDAPVADDALLVAEAVARLPERDMRLDVMSHAVRGSRPDWGQGRRFRLEPRIEWRGRSRKPEVWGQDVDQPFCPLVAVDHPDYVQDLRRGWLRWAKGVELVARWFETRTLSRFEVVGRGVELMPWR
ncbi:MAG: hypothetical protein Alpg2KO_14520 [Alphaproteobacteria bacterium]